MQQRYHTFAPSQSDMSEILYTWHTALAVARASEEADLYACVTVLVMESLEQHTTILDLIDAYFSLHAVLKARVLTFCGEGKVHLEPWVLMGAACALQLHQLMDDAIS